MDRGESKNKALFYALISRVPMSLMQSFAH